MFGFLADIWWRIASALAMERVEGFLVHFAEHIDVILAVKVKRLRKQLEASFCVLDNSSV